MPGRLGPRFALEAGFLILLAVAMGLADLGTTAIVIVMAIAWVLVALVEWIASRESRYPVRTAWPPAPPPAPGPPDWGEHEQTAFITGDNGDADTAAEPMPLPAEPAPRRRRWRRRSKSA